MNDLLDSSGRCQPCVTTILPMIDVCRRTGKFPSNSTIISPIHGISTKAFVSFVLSVGRDDDVDVDLEAMSNVMSSEEVR
jgi:hypothetical protein